MPIKADESSKTARQIYCRRLAASIGSTDRLILYRDGAVLRLWWQGDTARWRNITRVVALLFDFTYAEGERGGGIVNKAENTEITIALRLAGIGALPNMPELAQRGRHVEPIERKD